MQEEDPLRHFNTLGLPATATWDEVKRTYRQLIRRWHPDRAPAEGVSQHVSEERSKEITIAYKALSSYHRDHGELPRPRPVPVTPPPRATAPSPARTHEPPPPDKPPVQTVPSTGAKPRWLYASLLVVAAIVMAFILIPSPGPVAVSTLPAVSSEPAAAATESTQPPGEPETAPGAEISVGSTLGDVYAIQGIPSRTEGDTWHYGLSRVHFRKGRVVNWEEHPDNPLHVAARGTQSERKPLYFGIGSTRADVLRLQGPPLNESGSVWEYGASRVYFRGDLVVKWQESPLNPLRVRR